MFKNYLKSAYRSLIRQKLYSGINIFGLSIGIALFVMIAMYIVFEWQFDKFHDNYENIYRIEQDYGGTGTFVSVTHHPLGPKFTEDYPEILDFVRIKKLDDNTTLKINDVEFNDVDGLWTEKSLFNIFSFPIVVGSHESFFEDPFSMLLTEETAEKYFSDENPIGKVIRLNDNFNYKVTGIVKNPPENSHIQFDYLLNIHSYEKVIGRDYLSVWQDFQLNNYLLLDKNADLENINTKIHDILRDHLWDTYPSHIYLKPISELHFNSASIAGLDTPGSITRVYILLAIGLFIIIIAVINFMNLTTANATRRAKEVGVRKAVGASRPALIKQFLFESVFTSLIALIISFVFIKLLLPKFNELVNRSFEFTLSESYIIILIMILFAVVIGVLSGSYPAFYLSHFKPVVVLKGVVEGGKNKSLLRKALVTFQFIITVILISGSLLILKQLHFLKNKDLGFNKDHIYVASFLNADSTTIGKYKNLKVEMLQNPNINNISISRFISNSTYGYNASTYQGGDVQDVVQYIVNNVDEDYVDTWGIKLVNGEKLDNNFDRDSVVDCMVNEAAVKRFNWENPIGNRIGYGIVKGTVHDFHIAFIRSEIEPMVIYPIIPNSRRLRGRWFNFSMKLTGTNLEQTVDDIHAKFEEFFPGVDHDMRFYDEDFEILVNRENELAETVKYLTAIAIIIAALGLFALSSFMCLQMTKEIGIRKVHGAKITDIVRLIGSDFFKLIIIANVIALPASYFIVEKWLESFAYTTNISWWVFAISVTLSLIIAIFTVAYNTIKAANQNPALSLRFE